MGFAGGGAWRYGCLSAGSNSPGAPLEHHSWAASGAELGRGDPPKPGQQSGARPHPPGSGGLRGPCSVSGEYQEMSSPGKHGRGGCADGAALAGAARPGRRYCAGSSG